MIRRVWIRAINLFNLVLSAGGGSARCARIPGLHLEYRPEQIVRCGGEEADLRVGMQSIQMRTFAGQIIVDVAMVAYVVGVGGCGETCRQQQIPVDQLGLHVLLEEGAAQPPIPVVRDVATVHYLAK